MRTVTIYIKGSYSHTMQVNATASNAAVYDLLVSEGYKDVTVVG